MAYGLRTSAPVTNARFEHDHQCLTAEPWQQLSEACRLALVERALAPRSLFPDGLPAAL